VYLENAMFTGFARRVLFVAIVTGCAAVGGAFGLSRFTSDPLAVRSQLAAWIGPDRPLRYDPETTGSLNGANVVLDPCTGKRKN
jgi:hypothetical protein